MASETLKGNPLESGLFVFSNKRRNRLKILFWDGAGLWVLAKRLEKGGFGWSKDSDIKNGKLHLQREALALLVGGVDLKNGMDKAWYERQEKGFPILCILILDTIHTPVEDILEENAHLKAQLSSKSERIAERAGGSDRLVPPPDVRWGKSEKVDMAQMELLFKGLEQAKAEAAGASKPSPKGKSAKPR